MTDEEFLALAQRNAFRLNQVLMAVPRIYGDPSRFLSRTPFIEGITANTTGGRVTIGENCFFGHDVMLLAGTHEVRKFSAERIRSWPESGLDIEIEPGAWIASRAIVIGPARIGHDSVIAAGSVVRGNVEPFTIYAGNPARKVHEIEH